jgi:hypothetical protein
MAVTIDIRDYEKRLQAYSADLADNAATHDEAVHSKKYDPETIARQIDKVVGAPAGEVARQRNPKAVNDLIRQLLADKSGIGTPEFREVLDLVHVLEDFGETLTSDKPKSREEIAREFEQDAQRLLGQITESLNLIKRQIDTAIGHIPTWTAEHVVVSPSFYSENAFTEHPTIHVALGAGSDAPNFTIFTDETGKLSEIEDVLEGGDTDYFRDPDIQADYFNLINELRHPGSTQQGRNLTLWTARPRADRAKYEHASTVPPNIFLTSKADTAQGLASDLGGSEGTRDVWRVVINSKYLVTTRDGGPGNRDFQTVGKGPIPVERLELFYEGDKSNRVAARFLRASVVTATGNVRIVIDRDATLKARHSIFGGAIVGTFASSITLYRVVDKKELGIITRTGQINGGSFAVKNERAFGASWGADIDDVIRFGQLWRGNRIGTELFILKTDAIDKRFYQIATAVAFEAEGPEFQQASLDPRTCSTGSGCSIRVAVDEIDSVYRLSPEGHMEPVTLEMAAQPG